MGMKLDAESKARHGQSALMQFLPLGERAATPELAVRADVFAGRPAWRIALRNPFYTSVPVSGVLALSVTVGGRTVAPEHTRYVLRDMAIPVQDTTVLFELMWNFGELGAVLLTDPALSLTPGTVVPVEIDLALRPSFDGYHLPNDRIDYHFTREMEVLA